MTESTPNEPDTLLPEPLYILTEWRAKSYRPILWVGCAAAATLALQRLWAAAIADLHELPSAQRVDAVLAASNILLQCAFWLLCFVLVVSTVVLLIRPRRRTSRYVEITRAPAHAGVAAAPVLRARGRTEAE